MEASSGDRENTITPSGSAGLTPKETEEFAKQAAKEAGFAESKSVPFTSKVREAAESGNVIGTGLRPIPGTVQNPSHAPKSKAPLIRRPAVRKFVLSTTVLALLGIVGVILVSNRRPRVTLTHVTKGPITVAEDLRGIVRVRDHVIVRAEHAGTLLQLNVKEGGTLLAGSVVGKLDDPSLNARLLNLENEVEVVRQRVQALEKSVEGIMTASFSNKSQSVADSIRAALHSSEHLLAEKEEELLSLRREQLAQFVKTPVGGKVMEVLVTPGQAVEAGQDLFALGTSGYIEIEAELPKTSDTLLVGQKVKITQGKTELEGFLSKLIKTDTGSMGIVSIFATNPALKAGESIRVRVVQAEKERAVVAPANAVKRVGGITFAWTVQDQKAVKVPFKAGLISDTWVEALNGLDSGLSLIANPPTDLEEGTTVKFEE